MAFTIINSLPGYLPIAGTDTGYTTANGTALAIPTPPMTPGMLVTATDPTFGAGEFILMTGVASNIVGALVTYSANAYTPVLCANTANQAGPVAVSMVANTATTSWSWYQISGNATVKKTAVKVDPALAKKMTISATAGRVMQTSAAGKAILGAAAAATATVTSTTSTCVVTLDRPHLTAV